MSQRVFLLPDVGEGLIEAEIVTWKVGVGDVVVLNQPLVDVETAKAVVELPSPYAGTVVVLHGDVGDTMEVDQPLVTFEVPGPSDVTLASPPDVVAALPDPREQRRDPVLTGYGVANEEGPATRRARRRAGVTALAVPLDEPARDEPPRTGAVSRHLFAGSAVRTTPPVRLLAKQLRVDLALVTGTGRDGLVTREDVERARGAAESNLAETPTGALRFAGRDIESWSHGAKEERIPVKGVLKSMADAMVQSASEQPQAAVWVRVDATRTMDLIASLKNRPDFSAVRLSPLTLVALAVCDAARHYPGINSGFDADRGEVVVRRFVNLGIAADTPRGLVVPNIKGADRLGLRAMADQLTLLVETARRGTTSPADMLGTTLSITNVGPFAVDGAVALVPPGTGAIVCVGQVAPTPWVLHDEVVVRRVVEISMTFDHRQIDGALASRVLGHIARFLEDPAPALLAQ